MRIKISEMHFMFYGSTNLWLDKSLSEEFSHIILHSISNLIGTETLQHDDLLEIIQIIIPFTRQWFSVWIYAVKDAL